MSDIFNVLADPTRRALLSALAVESRTVGELVALTGEGQPTVSKHLKTLRDAGLVSVAAEGQTRVYSLDHGPLAEITAYLTEIAPGLGGVGAGASAKSAKITKSGASNEVEKTLTEAAVVLSGWINEGAKWTGAKVQQTVTENNLTPKRLGRDLGRLLADTKLQATDAAGDAQAALRAEIGHLSSRFGVQAADLRFVLEGLIEDARESVADKIGDAKLAMRRKSKSEPVAAWEDESDQ